MDKIDELEKRIKKLEARIHKLEKRPLSEELTKLRILYPDPEYRVDIFEKYSEKNLADETKKFAIDKAIETAKKKSDTAKKLEFWIDYWVELVTAGLLSEPDSYHSELFVFVNNIIQMYQMDIIKRLVDEGKYYEGRGNQPKFDPEKTVKWWDFISSFPLGEEGSKELNKMIINMIRKWHNPDDLNTKDGIPHNPTAKIIKIQLRKAGKIK